MHNNCLKDSSLAILIDTKRANQLSSVAKLTRVLNCKLELVSDIILMM